MLLDRKLQFDILQALEDEYPNSMLVTSFPCYEETRKFMANLFYLKDRGLIDGGYYREPGLAPSMVDVQITVDGLDFLKGDDGLTAILTLRKISCDLLDVGQSIQTGLLEKGWDEEVVEKLISSLLRLDQEQMCEIMLALIKEGGKAAKNQELLQVFCRESEVKKE